MAQELLRQAQTDEQLAQEVLAGGLNPERYASTSNRGPLSEVVDEDDSDEVYVQIRMLLASALNSGQLRSLARAIVLAWQADYDSTLLRQAEPKLVKKAQEVQLKTDIKNAMEQEHLGMLSDCMQRASELGLTECNYPILSEAIALERKLEEKARNIQDANRPAHNHKMGTVIGEMSNKFFGLDVQQLQADVEKEGASAKEAIDRNVNLLKSSIRALEDARSQPTSSEKLATLKEIQKTFRQINPTNLEERVASLNEEVDNLRADNTTLMLAMKSGGSQVVKLGTGSPGENGHGDLEQYRTRIQELEDNEEILRERIDQAAKLGAKWMEEKKDKEIAELQERLTADVEKIRAEQQQIVEQEIKRRSVDISKSEKKAKVIALKGLEEALKRNHVQEVQQLQRNYREETEGLKRTIQEAEKRIAQLQKVIRMRG